MNIFVDKNSLNGNFWRNLSNLYVKSEFIQGRMFKKLRFVCFGDFLRNIYIPKGSVGALKSIYDERTLKFAHYITQNGATIRDTAKKFGISKSTVHKDITSRLSELDGALCEEVRAVLDKNKSERHLRGGQATKIKYSKKSDKENK